MFYQSKPAIYLIATNDKLAHPTFQIFACEELSLEALDQINKLPPSI